MYLTLPHVDAHDIHAPQSGTHGVGSTAACREQAPSVSVFDLFLAVDLSEL